MANRSQRHPQLLRIIALGQGSETICSLAEALQVSTKTVRRDLADLRKLGFVIKEDGDPNEPKKLSLTRDAIAKVHLNFDEAFSLMLYREGKHAFDGTLIGKAAEVAFAKVGNALGRFEKDYVRRMVSRVRCNTVGGDYSQHSETIEALMIAIEDTRAILLTYLSARSTEPVTYSIEPYGIVEHRGTLYVVGYSQRHAEIRTWKVDRIQAAEVTERSFALPTDFDLDEHFAGAFAIVRGEKPVEVIVRFMGTATRYVQEKRMHPTQQVELHSDGSALARFQLTSTLEIRSWILSFGSAAEVLSPSSLRSEIKQEVVQMLAHYHHQGSTTDGRDGPS